MALVSELKIKCLAHKAFENAFKNELLQHLGATPCSTHTMSLMTNECGVYNITLN